MRRHAATAVALAVTLGLAAACGRGGGTKATPRSSPSTAATSTIPSGTNALPTVASESGREPIFWRTADSFASLQAGQAYKVLFRITNGYAEPSLTVTATCLNCPAASERQPVSFEGRLAQPAGADLPGSYYPTNITLPQAGRWEIDVTAGGGSATIPVEVGAGRSAG